MTLDTVCFLNSQCELTVNHLFICLFTYLFFRQTFKCKGRLLMEQKLKESLNSTFRKWYEDNTLCLYFCFTFLSWWLQLVSFNWASHPWCKVNFAKELRKGHWVFPCDCRCTASLELWLAILCHIEEETISLMGRREWCRCTRCIKTRADTGTITTWETFKLSGFFILKLSVNISLSSGK